MMAELLERTHDVAEPTYVSFHSRSGASVSGGQRRSCHAEIRTLLQLLKALESDFELVRRVKGRRVVLDLDAEKRHDRHGGDGMGMLLSEDGL
jgi:hypothetical protein